MRRAKGRKEEEEGGRRRRERKIDRERRVKGDSGCREERGRSKGKGKAPISQLTHSFRVPSEHEHVYGGPGPLETARVPNVPKPLAIVMGFSNLVLAPRETDVSNVHRLYRQGGDFRSRKISLDLNRKILRYKHAV